mgnify:CR=1 FL=1
MTAWTNSIGAGGSHPSKATAPKSGKPKAKHRAAARGVERRLDSSRAEAPSDHPSRGIAGRPASRPRRAAPALEPGRSRRWFGPSALAALAIVASLVVSADPARAAGGKLKLTVVDRDTGQMIPCRLHLRDAQQRPRKVSGAIQWADHAVIDGAVVLELPPGEYRFEMERGPEYLRREGHFTINPFADDAKQVDMKRFFDMTSQGWWSGDLDVRRDPSQLERLMAAEDLHVAGVVTWGVRGDHDVKQSAGQASPAEPGARFDGGRLCDLRVGLMRWPGNELLLIRAHEPKHFPPEDQFPILSQTVAAWRRDGGAWIDLTRPTWQDLPVLVALGAVDSIELAPAQLERGAVADSDSGGRPRDKSRFPGPLGVGQWAHHVYFQLLEAGLRIPPSAGSGSGASPNPVGYNRVYVRLDSALTEAAWWEGLKAGRVVVTNGPLLVPSVHGQPPGYVFEAPEGTVVDLEIALTLSSRDPISYLEIIKDGRVERSIRFDEYAKTGRLPKVVFDRSGWFLLRVVTDLSKTYRFAMTGPYYVEIGGQRRVSRRAVEFFIEWIYQRADALRRLDPPPPRAVFEDWRTALLFWKNLLEQANAE